MNIFITLFASLILTACSTVSNFTGLRAPTNPNKVSGFWQAKAEVKDLSTKKTHEVNLDITGFSPDKLRIDVTGTFGIPLASIVLNNKLVAYNLYRQKKFYYGATSNHALRPILNIDMNPSTLVNVSFDKIIESPDWSCKSNDAGLAESCTRNGGETIQWMDRDGENKKVLIKGKTFELQMVYKSYSVISTKVLKERKVFQLTPPNGFKRYKIP
jgi:hypothetical protein